MKGIFHLEGTIKHYDWGGFSFIPALLGKTNTEKQPYAEYWMGIHPLGTSGIVIDNERQELSKFATDLPYLFKVLDVKQMLSIQVHPTKEAAAIEFARENESGIPLDSPQRNYKDANHKPELMVALSNFWLLHGFKPRKELEYTLLNVVELRELLPVYNQGDYKGLYQFVMEMPQEDVNRILQPLIDNINNVYTENTPEKADEDYWAIKAAKHFTKNGKIDRGIFSIYLMNLVQLEKGQGIFQSPGVPHAYLEGQNVEIMANSDNVLRGGLTTKHIAVEELMKHIRFEPTDPQIIVPEILGKEEKLYRTPAPDFRLSVYEAREGEVINFETIGTEILLVIEGETVVTSGDTGLILKQGKPAAIGFGGNMISIKALERSRVFRASLPVNIAE